MAASWQPIKLLLVYSLLLFPSDAKNHGASIRLGGVRAKNLWKYTTKFGYGIGVGKWSFRVKLNKPTQLTQDGGVTLELHLDEDWADTMAEQDPCKRSAKARDVWTLPVPGNGEWGDWTNGTVRQAMRPHLWYFAISECNNTSENSMPSSTHHLYFQFHGTQEDDSEIGTEFAYMRSLNTLNLIAFTVLLWSCFNGTLAYFRSVGEVHPVIQALTVGLCIQYVAYLFRTLHLWLYGYNGYGIWGLDFLAELFLMITEVLLTSLLIVISLGYTLLHSTLGDLDVMIPATGMITMIHIMLVAIGKITRDDAADKHFENEGIIGWLLFTLRIGLFLWFLWAVQSTAAVGGVKLDSFLRKFRTTGSAYFLSYPILFLIVQVLAPYWQHCIFSSGLMATNMLNNIWLAQLFLKRGDYFKVSTLNASVLPGGAGGSSKKN